MNASSENSESIVAKDLQQELAPSNTVPTQSSVSASAEPQQFAEMNLHPSLMAGVSEMGFAQPFPVQKSTYLPITSGTDVLVQSKTGSGKTAAFGIPLLQQWLQGQDVEKITNVYGLVLVPTRELALQVAKQFEQLGQHAHIPVVAIYGGAPIGPQVEALSKQPAFVIGTPGRVLDHIRRGTLVLGGLRVLVFDEADEMFSRGFYEEIVEVLRNCPDSRQTLLFSATLPNEVGYLSSQAMKSPVHINLSTDATAAAEIHHAYYMVSGMGRTKDLLRVLDIEQPESGIVFCNTREETEDVASFLRNQGLDAQAISSNLTQAARERVMGLMKAQKLHYLVATDVAARGIDISKLSHVINYTFPESPEVYIHRTGRTGRAGQVGTAISLIGPRELASFYTFKLTYKIQPVEKTFPSAEELQTLRHQQHVRRLDRELIRQPASVFVAMVQTLAQTEKGLHQLGVLLERFLTSAAPSEKLDLPLVEANSSVGHSSRTKRTPVNKSTFEHREPRASKTHGYGTDHSSKSTESEPGNADASDSGRKERKKRPERSERSKTGSRPSARAARATELLQPLPHDPIEVSEGREYWEAWVDSRQAAPPVASTENHSAESSQIKEPESQNLHEENKTQSSLQGHKLYLNVGKRHGAKLSQLQGFLVEQGLPAYPVLIRFTHSYVLVPEEQIEATVTTLHGKAYKNRTLVCERAREAGLHEKTDSEANVGADDSSTAEEGTGDKSLLTQISPAKQIIQEEDESVLQQPSQQATEPTASSVETQS